jgi:hypothetical protein
MSTTEYVIRRYGDGTYGLGEEVISGVYLFRSSDQGKNYNLTWEELQVAIRRQKKAVIKQEGKR